VQATGALVQRVPESLMGRMDVAQRFFAGQNAPLLIKESDVLQEYAQSTTCAQEFQALEHWYGGARSLLRLFLPPFSLVPAYRIITLRRCVSLLHFHSLPFAHRLMSSF
jgi:hypothetical protein